MPNNSLKNLSSMLGKVIEEKKEFKKRMQDDRDAMIMGMGEDIVNLLLPLLKEMAETARLNKMDLLEVLKRIRVDANVKAPDVKVNVPDVRVPEIKVPQMDDTRIVEAIKGIKIKNDILVPDIDVRVPEIKVPDIIMPKEMDIRGWVQLQGVDLNNPLPVQLRDADGKPVKLFENLTTLIGGAGGGGKTDYFTIKDIRASSVSIIDQDTGALKVVMSSSASGGITDGELRASSVPVEQVSGSIWSTNVLGSFGTLYTDSSMLNSDNRLRVSVETGGSGLTDSELRAVSLPVEQVSGSMWSVSVTGFSGSMGATLLNGDGTYRDTMPIQGTVAVSGITNTVATALVDSSGIQYSSSNPIPIDDAGGTITVDGTVAVSGITNSTQATIIDSSGIGYSGSNPIPTYLVASAGNSTISVGDLASDVADTGSSPVKIGGIARTTNPSAVASGDRVSASFDDVGRQMTRPINARDLLLTAYVTEDEIQEVALLAGVASEYHDMVYVLCANESTAAINLDFRQTTGGTVQMSVEVPANGTAGVSLPVPIPQDHADATWTVKNSASDNSNTVYSVTALFSKEV